MLARAGIGDRLTVVLADFVVSALLVAVIVAVEFEVIHGAVYKPVVVMLPCDAFHVTPVFVVLMTIAVNCNVCSETRLPPVGVTEMATARLPSGLGRVVCPTAKVVGCARKANVKTDASKRAGLCR